MRLCRPEPEDPAARGEDYVLKKLPASTLPASSFQLGAGGCPQPQSSSLGLRTSDLGLRTSDLGPRTSDLGLRAPRPAPRTPHPDFLAPRVLAIRSRHDRRRRMSR